MANDDTKAPGAALPPSGGLAGFETMPGKNGGRLRRGGSNGGRRKSLLARDILEARTPAAARLLIQAALDGTLPSPSTKQNKELSHPDRIKAIGALLDRGGVPTAHATAAEVGEPFIVQLTAGPSVPAPPPPAAPPGAPA